MFFQAVSRYPSHNKTILTVSKEWFVERKHLCEEKYNIYVYLNKTKYWPNVLLLKLKQKIDYIMYALKIHKILLKYHNQKIPPNRIHPYKREITFTWWVNRKDYRQFSRAGFNYDNQNFHIFKSFPTHNSFLFSLLKKRKISK